MMIELIFTFDLRYLQSRVYIMVAPDTFRTQEFQLNTSYSLFLMSYLLMFTDLLFMICGDQYPNDLSTSKGHAIIYFIFFPM